MYNCMNQNPEDATQKREISEHQPARKTAREEYRGDNQHRLRTP